MAIIWSIVPLMMQNVQLQLYKLVYMYNALAVVKV